MRFHFDEFVCDEPKRQLFHQGARVEIQPKALELLLYLLENRDRDVSKEELGIALWPDATVTGSSLTKAMNLARNALSASPTGRGLIRTIRGRGYRMGVSVRIEAAEDVLPAPPAGPFVGRKAELGVLGAALDQARAGAGNVALVVGDPGIGKTRLLEEFSTRAIVSGAEVLWGRCHQGESETSHWLWVQVFRQWARGRSSEALRSVAAGDAGALAALDESLVDELAISSPAASARQQRFELFDGLASTLRRAAKVRPLVIVLDDLHWADAPSLAFASFFAQRLVDAPVLMIMTYRDQELDPREPTGNLIAEMVATSIPSSRQLLSGLGAAEVAELVRAAGPGEYDAAYVDRVLERTEGNPFFVLELLQLDREGGARSAHALPDGVRHVIRRRLEGLPAPVREALDCAAALGRTFRIDVLAHVLGCPRAELLERLEPAERDRLIRAHASPARLEFTHALIQEWLYSEFSTRQRVDWHARIGEALESIYAGHPDTPFADLAHHFHEAAAGGDHERSILWNLEAARRAQAQLGYEQSKLHYERALQDLEGAPPVDPSRRCSLLLDLGYASFRAAELARSEQCFRRVVETARREGDVQHFARAIEALAHHQIGNIGMVPHERIGLLEEALNQLEPEGPARVRLLAALGNDLYWTGDLARCLELNREATDLALALGDAEGLARAVDYRFQLLVLGSDVPERRQLIDQEIELSRRRGDLEQEFVAWTRMLSHCKEEADPGGISTALSHCESLAQQLADPSRTASIEFFHATTALSEGRLALAEQLGQQASEAFSEGRSPVLGFLLGSVHLWVLRRLQGRARELEAMIDQGLVEFGHAVAFKVARVALDVLADDPERATQGFESLAADDFAALQKDMMYRINLAEMAMSCVSLGLTEHAPGLIRVLEPFSGKQLAMASGVSYGAADRYLGLLHEVLGERGAARLRFEEALSIERRMRSETWEAWALHDLGRLLASEGHPRDSRQALQRAFALAERIGLAPLVAQLEEAPILRLA